MANVGQGAAYAALSNLDGLFDNGTLSFWAGTIPASPETAITSGVGGYTNLVTWTFAAAAFASPAFSSGAQSALAAFVATSVAPTTGGTVAFARAVAPAWIAAHAYTVGMGVTNSGNIYQCVVAGTSAASGGPTGTSASPVGDGTSSPQLQWIYVGPGPAIMDYTVGTSGTDIIVGNTTIQTGTNVSMSLTHRVTAT